MRKNKYIPAFQAGLYFLIKDEKVVYVGQTKNLSARMAGHLNKDYDKYRFIQCPEHLLKHYENRWILRFSPILNKTKIKAGDDSLTITISVAVTKQQKEMIVRTANKNKVKVGAFLRQAVEEKLFFELSK